MRGQNYTHGTMIQGKHNRYTRRTVAHKNKRVYVQVLLGIITQPLNNFLGRPMNTGHPLNEALQPYGCSDRLLSTRVFVVSVLLVQIVCICSSNVC